MFRSIVFLGLIIGLTGINQARGERIHIAVASNFTATMKQLVAEFESSTGHQVSVSYGSSGKFYAQILHGAPYVMFFSADQDKVDELIDKQMTVKGSQFTYAIGRLALWSNKSGHDIPSAETLARAGFNKIAIANPKLAPYGAAAAQVIESLELTQALENKIVRGENIGQTYQFVSTGNVDFGFVALAQLLANVRRTVGDYWLVPDELHHPIKQDAVLLKKGESSEAAQAFLSFMKSAQAVDIIESFGYQSDKNYEGSLVNLDAKAEGRTTL